MKGAPGKGYTLTVVRTQGRTHEGRFVATVEVML